MNPIDLYFYHNHVDVVGKHENKWQLVARRGTHKGKVVGYVDYTTIVGDRTVHLDMIKVRKDLMRSGIATAMIREIEREHDGAELSWGWITKAGEGLKRSLAKKNGSGYFGLGWLTHEGYREVVDHHAADARAEFGSRSDNEALEDAYRDGWVRVSIEGIESLWLSNEHLKQVQSVMSKWGRSTRRAFDLDQSPFNIFLREGRGSSYTMTLGDFMALRNVDDIEWFRDEETRQWGTADGTYIEPGPYRGPLPERSGEAYARKAMKASWARKAARERGIEENPRPKYGYHVVPTRVLPIIKRHGLLSPSPQPDEQPDETHFHDNVEDAMEMAQSSDTILRFAFPKDANPCDDHWTTQTRVPWKKLWVSNVIVRPS